jgi:hypothetical protein
MTSCSYCGQRILFGGIKQGEFRFCKPECQSNGYILSAAAAVPVTAAEALAHQIHMGICPRCKGPGPVDVHSTHWVWSALAFTRWGSQQQIRCRPCAVKSQVGNLVFSSLLGWWGLPFGLLITPVQVVRNVIAIASPPEPSQPSPKLIQIARLQLASQPKT